MVHSAGLQQNSGDQIRRAIIQVQKKRLFWKPSMYKNDQFTKTGSGQT